MRKMRVKNSLPVPSSSCDVSEGPGVGANPRGHCCVIKDPLPPNWGLFDGSASVEGKLMTSTQLKKKHGIFDPAILLPGIFPTNIAM